MARRTPARLADACAGVLAGAIAVQVGASAELFQRYAEGHAARVLPPLLTMIGKGVERQFSPADIWRGLRQIRETQVNMSRVQPSETPQARERRVRDLFSAFVTKLDLDEVPSGAIQPIVDHFVAMVITEWDAEHASQPPRRPDTVEPHEA